MSDPFGLWHNHHGDQKLRDPIDDFDLFLKEQGLRVERELLLKRHPSFVDLKETEFRSAVQQTANLLKTAGSTIYGGALQSGRLAIHARPDVLMVNEGRCSIEEYKLAGTPEAAHEIQALAYAYMLKKEYGLESECKVVSRLNEEFVIPYDESRIEEAIQLARDIVARGTPPPPIYNCRSNWSTLQNKIAKEQGDITLTWNVGPVLANKLRETGVYTLEDLVRLDPKTLKSIPGVGPKKTTQILNSAKAQVTCQPIKVGNWEPADHRPELEIFLDLEGSGELFQDDPAWNCIYLIGLIPRGNGIEQPYTAHLAKKPDEERRTLEGFLDYLRSESRPYRLYHWHHYEKTQLKKACDRHGMTALYESLVLPYLEDLCAAAQASYVLPTPGWSIKVVAPYFGFKWTQDASEVDAMKSAMMWFKQVLAGGNGEGLDKVLQYNEDDCRAMIVVKDGFENLEKGS
ncbi:MAG: TM0106 family RecB-like putative nuclease [Deltaproteobacteria bacterium]|nr:TM0106 family RecB-like putative nuclease [Deltaproteobacteria bacterium]